MLVRGSNETITTDTQWPSKESHSTWRFAFVIAEDGNAEDSKPLCSRRPSISRMQHSRTIFFTFVCDKIFVAPIILYDKELKGENLYVYAYEIELFVVPTAAKLKSRLKTALQGHTVSYKSISALKRPIHINQMAACFLTFSVNGIQRAL